MYTIGSLFKTNCAKRAARGFKERLGEGWVGEAASLRETIMKTLQHRGPNLFMIPSSTKATVPVEPCIVNTLHRRSRSNDTENNSLLR